MKRYALTLAALILSASAVMADQDNPVFNSSDLKGAYVLSIAGTNTTGSFNYVGVVRFDGVGHLVNTTSLPSYIINRFSPNLPANQCRFNIMTPAVSEVPAGTTNLYTVSALDSSIRIPIKYVAFQSQAAVCQATNNTISTISGTLVNPSLGVLNLGTAASGTLQKQLQTP